MFFDTREEMEDFARRQPDEVLMAIEFRSADGNGNFPADRMDAEFSIRVNAQLLPSTFTRAGFVRAGSFYSYPYIDLGFTMLQEVEIRRIGRALLQWFAKEHHVAGCGTAKGELEELRRSLPDALLEQVNVCQEDAVRRWLGSIGEKWGRIDLLVASAGSMPSLGSVWETPADEWQRACAGFSEGIERYMSHTSAAIKSQQQQEQEK
eukprot:s758_g13.t1